MKAITMDEALKRKVYMILHRSCPILHTYGQQCNGQWNRCNMSIFNRVYAKMQLQEVYNQQCQCMGITMRGIYLTMSMLGQV